MAIWTFRPVYAVYLLLVGFVSAHYFGNWVWLTVLFASSDIKVNKRR